MNNNLGAVFSNSGEQYFNIQPSQVRTAISTDTIAKNLIAQILSSPAGSKIVKHFTSRKPGFWKPILNNQNLNPCDKIERIFGVKFNEMFKQAALLGNIFEDIGNWFNSGGAERLANQVENTSNDIARVLNAIRNRPDTSQTQTNIRDFESKTFFGIQDFIQNYGIWIIGGLVLFLFIKK